MKEQNEGLVLENLWKMLRKLPQESWKRAIAHLEDRATLALNEPVHWSDKDRKAFYIFNRRRKDAGKEPVGFIEFEQARYFGLEGGTDGELKYQTATNALSSGD